MTCKHCKANMETNLEKLDFITSAHVKLANKSVIIEGDKLEIVKAKSTIESIGCKCM